MNIKFLDSEIVLLAIRQSYRTKEKSWQCISKLNFYKIDFFMWKMRHFGEIFRLCDHWSPNVLCMLLLELCSNFHITQALWKHGFYFTFYKDFYKVVQVMSIDSSIIMRPQKHIYAYPGRCGKCEPETWKSHLWGQLSEQELTLNQGDCEHNGRPPSKDRRIWNQRSLGRRSLQQGRPEMGWWGCKARKVTRKASSSQPSGETQHWWKFACFWLWSYERVNFCFTAHSFWYFIIATLGNEYSYWSTVISLLHALAGITCYIHKALLFIHLYFEKWNSTISYFQEHSP